MPALMIKLEKQEWRRGQSLGRGGFAEVYGAEGTDGTQAAMKIFRKVPAAAREMEFRSIPSHPNILPILDFGEYKNDYVLIMPRADKSLDRYIETQRRSFLLENAIPILLDIAEALASLHGNVVHQMRGSIGFLNAHANTP